MECNEWQLRRPPTIEDDRGLVTLFALPCYVLCDVLRSEKSLLIIIQYAVLVQPTSYVYPL